MKKIRKIFLVLLSILFVMSSLTADAHPGRLDANGGHWNRKTGEYHYHRSNGRKISQKKKRTSRRRKTTSRRSSRRRRVRR